MPPDVVAGNDVREGATRIGVVDKVQAVRRADGTTFARLHVKLQKSVEPLPIDHHGARARALGAGSQVRSRSPRARPLAASRRAPRCRSRRRARAPVEIDEVLNTLRPADPQTASRASLEGFGTGLAGRGIVLNQVIEELPPALRQPPARHAEPGGAADASSCACSRRSSGPRRLVAPVASDQAALFQNLDITFTALADVARPSIQDTISKSPPTLDAGISNFPQQRPFLENTAAFARELRPGVRVLPTTLPDLADALTSASRA